MDLIQYLSRNNGANLDRIIPGLMKINDQYRFDASRFDMLSCTSDNFFYGIKILKPNTNLVGLQKIVDNSKWIKRFNGASLILIDARDYSLYKGVFSDASLSKDLTTKYYHIEGKEFFFSDNVVDYSALALREKSTIAAKVLTHPQVVSAVLRKFEKKNELLKPARVVYDVYSKVK